MRAREERPRAPSCQSKDFRLFFGRLGNNT